MEALAQVPTWALVGGAVACAVVAVRLWLGQSWVFKIMYFLFAHTPLGPWWHRRGVAQHRAKHGSQPHRATHTTQHNGYSVTSVAFLSDNYAYVLKDHATGSCALVDPADPEAVLAALGAEDAARVTHILTTHRHADHAGGNAALAAKLGDGVDVVGGRNERVEAATVELGDGDEVSIGDVRVTALASPGHTVGHLMFLARSVAGPEEAPRALFTGDCLFVGGCGKFFEGDAGDMAVGLLRKLGELPPQTRVYPGHEYAAASLAFCAWVEPDNADVERKVAEAASAAERGVPCVPSTLGEEARHNSFLRCGEPSVAKAAGLGEGADPVAVLAALRQLKDVGAHTKKAVHA